MPWSSFGRGNINKSDFPGSSLFRDEKHLQNPLILWESSSSSMEMGHKIKEEGKEASWRWSGKRDTEMHIFVVFCVFVSEEEIKKLGNNECQDGNKQIKNIQR